MLSPADRQLTTHAPSKVLNGARFARAADRPAVPPLLNACHECTGALWEGRYRACLNDHERYLLACQHYIELAPVRARIINDPAAWLIQLRRASGPAQRIAVDASPRLAGTAPRSCQARKPLGQLLVEALSEEDLTAIPAYLQQQRALGRDDFRAMIEARTQRFAGTRPAHRPARFRK